MWLKYISTTVLLVLLACSISAEEEKKSWSWGAEETLDPKDPLPLETHSESPTGKNLSSTSHKDNSEVVLRADDSLDFASTQFEESGALKSDDVNVSLEEGDSSRDGRFLALGDKLCSLGIGSNCKKNYQPAVQSHYSAPVKTLAPSGSYGPSPVPLKPAGNYGPPPFSVPSAISGNYGPPPVKGYDPSIPVVVVSKPAAKPPNGFLGSISNAVSSILYKKSDAKPVAPYDVQKTEYTAPQPAYTPPKAAYSAPKGTPPKAVYTDSKPLYVAVEPVYSAPKPAYNLPKPAYTAPKPTYVAVESAYIAPNPAYNTPKPAYTAPKLAYNPPKNVYNTPKPTYTTPKVTYAAPTPNPAYTAPKASYAAPAAKPAYTAPKTTYANRKNSFVAPTETYAITKPIITTRLPTVTVAQAQSVVHHVHTHTHVYQGVPSVATVHAVAAAPTIIATPVTVSVPSVAYAQKSHVLIPSGSEQSIYVQSGTAVRLNEVKQYEEDCQCVPSDLCPAGNIINQRMNTNDISHLLDARNTPSDIKSNTTDVNETTSSGESKRKRRNTDEEVSEESNDEDAFTNRQGRQLKGFTPGLTGCSAGYICCRQPIYDPPNPNQAFLERKPAVTIHSSTLGSSRPSNVAQQPKSLSAIAISNHKTSEFKSHFSVKNGIQENPKPTIPAITSSNLHQQGPAYNEDCHCIPASFCSAGKVVPRISPKDISHLLDARNKDVAILSTVTDIERVRRSTDNATLESTGNFTENGNSTDRQGRQLLGVTPDSFGCHQGYVCCRRPVFDENKPKQISATPFNVIANTAAVAQKPRPVHSIITHSQTQQHPVVQLELSSTKQSTRTQTVVSLAYDQDCHCILSSFCPVNNIVPRNSPKDISHLLDARNKGSSILSADSEERVRRSTNEAFDNDANSGISARQGRQLQGYAPGKEGCGTGFVCCSPVFTPTRTQKAINRPSRMSIQVHSQHSPVVQVQRVPKPATVPTHTRKPVVLVSQQSVLQHPVPAYPEQCTCVAPNFCQHKDIIARSSQRDISHLLDARNSALNITSNATESRPETESVNDETLYSDIQGRQVKSFPPGIGGCHARTVCCRQPNFSVQNAILSASRPSVVGQTTKVLQSRSKYNCGRSNSQSLLGRVKTPHFEQGDSEFGEYPWQAAILKMADGDAQYVCGAALIDDQHLLTAAHCIDGIQPYNLKIRLGEWDVASESEFFSHIQIQVADVYIHNDYYKGNLKNDIAVMKLTSPVDFASNPHITPVCLPDPSADFRGQQCTVTGWGKDTFGSEGKFQKILKEVSVPIVDNRQCQDTLRTTRLGRSYSLDQGMLCAGGEEGKDACKGDGGSPLVCKGNNGAYQLIGLVSWGIGCGERGIPGVYVNIRHYITWINAIQNS